LGLEFLFIIYKFKQQPIEKLIRVYTKSLWILGFAILSEILQIYIPGRNFSIKDFVANTSGITIGLLIFMLFQNRILKLLFNDYEALNDKL
jgi:VanZ family protein